ncbi:hypothetical protein ABZX90_16715 [Streptomyces sp. NPDC002935]|uniref:hypothetical protein n=1 Tax=Streptomyces sp. NPDC002935 TaxID=3154545 RepID=UPI0033B2F874
MYRIRRLGAALAVLLGTLLAPTVPARAAAQPAVELSVPDTAYLTKRGISPTGGVRVWLAPHPGGGRATQADVTLTVDASDLEGIARLRTRRECGDHPFGATGVVTCRLGTLTRGKDNYPDAIYIEAVHGVSRGSHGTIRYTFSAPGAADATFETDVWVEGPELRARAEKPRKGDAPGASFGFKPQVRNAGRFPAQGFGIRFTSSRVIFPAQYSNCRYGIQFRTFADCWFDQQLEPGQAYELVEPVSVDVPETMVNGSFSYMPYLQGMTGNVEEYPGATGTDPALRQGTGPELRVRTVDTAADAFPDRYRRGEVLLHTSQTADLQVSADAIEGTTGSSTKATFSLHNAGPGRMSGTQLRITVPEGLSVVEPTPPPDPDNELEWAWECFGPRGRAYICSPENPLEPGDTWQTTLEFRIDRRVRGAKGLLEAIQDPKRPVNDPQKTDNVAPIEVRATGGPLAQPSEPNPKPSAAATGAATVEHGGKGDSILMVALAVLLGTALAGGALALRLRARAVRRRAEPSDPNED